MTFIDPAARVAEGANIGKNVSIGPFCVIGPHAEIGDECRLVSHVNVTGHTKIGAGTIVYPFASLGTPPQSKSYKGGATKLIIGANCEIRESVTMNTGTEDGGGITSVGDRGYFMVNSHIAHDCHVGNDVTFANGAALAGHCVVGDGVVMGGLSAVHQFTRIGTAAMIAGATGVRGDVIPFGLATGQHAELAGLNIVGMKRRKIPREKLHLVRQAYKKLFHGDGQFADRVNLVADEYGHDDIVAQIVSFIRENRDRTLCKPRLSRDAV